MTLGSRLEVVMSAKNPIETEESPLQVLELKAVTFDGHWDDKNFKFFGFFAIDSVKYLQVLKWSQRAGNFALKLLNYLIPLIYHHRSIRFGLFHHLAKNRHVH